MTTGFGLASALALQPDVKIVVAGGPGARMTLARCNPDGSLDPTFSSGGRVITDFGGPLSRATALAVQPDGKILVAGYSGDSTFSCVVRSHWYASKGGPTATVALSASMLRIALGPSTIPFQATVTLTQFVVPFFYTFAEFEPVGAYFAYAGLALAGSHPLQPANQLSLGVQAFQFNP